MGPSLAPDAALSTMEAEETFSLKNLPRNLLFFQLLPTIRIYLAVALKPSGK